MIVYQTNPRTGEYLREYVADPIPAENGGGFAWPPECVEAQPPAQKKGYARVWRDGAWVQVADHRGAVVYDAGGRAITVPTLGKIPEGLTLEPPLAAIKANALRAVVTFANGVTAKITKAVPEDEVRSWPTQEAEAQAVQAGGGGEAAPLLALMAAGEGVTVQDYAERVLTKAAAYRPIVAAVKKIRSMAEAGIEAAKTPDEVQAALDTAKAEALRRAAEMGLT